MVRNSLEGRRILVVEDEYLIADDLNSVLVAAGAIVIGPLPTVSEAMALIAAGGEVDAAVLDVNLRGILVFPVADALKERGVPFVFATGYDQETIPERFADAMRLEKPLKADKIVSAVGPLMQPSEP